MPTPSNQTAPRVPDAAEAAALLGRVQVAAPCTASWEAMPGGERVRSCEKCAHKVYNLSAMTSDEAAQLVARAEGQNGERVCVRFYRRSDGTMLTQDCPVGVRALRQRAARRVSVAFAAVGVVFGMNLTGKTRDEQPRLVQLVLNAIDPPAAPVPIDEPDPRLTRTTGMIALPMARDTPPPAPPSRATMGDMAVAPPSPVPQTIEMEMGGIGDPQAAQENAATLLKEQVSNPPAFTVPDTNSGSIKVGEAVAGRMTLRPQAPNKETPRP